MEPEKMKHGAVVIERSYYLMRLYNAINTSTDSLVFLYEGVYFWREPSGFVMQYKDTVYHAGDIVDFELFEKTLLLQKQSLNSSATIQTLKTLGGALHYNLTRYNLRELEPDFYDWAIMRSYLKMSDDTVYCLEVDKQGFVLTTKDFMLRYVHDSFSMDKRVIEYKSTYQNVNRYVV